MSRLLLVLLFAFGFSANSNADPIPKPDKIDSDKEAKKCVEAFFQAVKDSKVDDVLKLCAIPFLEPTGKVIESLDDLKAKFSSALPPPAGLEMKVEGVEMIGLEKLNDWRKKSKKEELDEKELKKYAELIGKNGRVAVVDVTINFQGTTDSQHLNLLIRFNDGKAKIVGSCKE